MKANEKYSVVFVTDECAFIGSTFIYAYCKFIINVYVN